MVEMNSGVGALSPAGVGMPQEVSARPWRPTWLVGEGNSPQVQATDELWRSFCEANAANVFVMPQIACLPHETDASPMVYAKWKPDGDVRSLGVLSARRLRLPILPKLSISLSARRLVGCDLAGDESAEAVCAFVDAAAGLLRNRECDCIVLQDVGDPSTLRQAFVDAPRRHPVICGVPIEPRIHRWIRFPSNPADYWSQFSKKTRYNFRWRAKHLDHRIQCVEKPRDVAEYTRHVSEFTANTWQYKKLGFRIDPVLKGQLWAELARLGAFRSYLLWHEDRIAAYAVGVQWKGLFRYEETGYDPAFAAKSPGQVLLYRLIEDLIARNTPQLLDFGSGDNEYKRIYSNHETLTGPVVLARRSARTISALVGNRLMLSVGKQARWALSQLGALSRLRHLRRGHAVTRGDEQGI